MTLSITRSISVSRARTRTGSAWLTGAAFVCSTSAFAQQSTKMHGIGVLWHGADAEQEAIYLAALRQGLKDFGYVEGQNIVLEMRFPAEQYERFFALAAELAQQKPDVLVCATAAAAVACHRATTTIPVVGVNVPDPVGRKRVKRTRGTCQITQALHIADRDRIGGELAR